MQLWFDFCDTKVLLDKSNFQKKKNWNSFFSVMFFLQVTVMVFRQPNAIEHCSCGHHMAIHCGYLSCVSSSWKNHKFWHKMTWLIENCLKKKRKMFKLPTFAFLLIMHLSEVIIARLLKAIFSFNWNQNWNCKREEKQQMKLVRKQTNHDEIYGLWMKQTPSD